MEIFPFYPILIFFKGVGWNHLDWLFNQWDQGRMIWQGALESLVAFQKKMQAIQMGWIHKQGNLEGLGSFPHEIPNRVMNLKILKYDFFWEEPASETDCHPNFGNKSPSQWHVSFDKDMIFLGALYCLGVY